MVRVADALSNNYCVGGLAFQILPLFGLGPALVAGGNALDLSVGRAALGGAGLASWGLWPDSAVPGDVLVGAVELRATTLTELRDENNPSGQRFRQRLKVPQSAECRPAAKTRSSCPNSNIPAL